MTEDEHNEHAYKLCPDDDDYECYQCGGLTGTGYDDGLCAVCLDEC